jgi:hypothetical protein
MANLASLVVSLTTKTEPFRKGMKKSESTLERFRKSALRAAKAATVLGVAAATAALAGITALTKAGLANVDVTLKMSQRLLMPR